MSVVSDAGRALIQDADGGWLAFERPLAVIATDRHDQVAATIARAEVLALERGAYAVGIVTYEAGGAWGLPVRAAAPGLPLAWFGLYDAGRVTKADEPPRTSGYRVAGLKPSVDRAAFDRAFARVRHHLADGDTYQVNYTFTMDGTFEGAASGLFADLVAAQHARYGAFVDLGRHAVCSASPELFFARQGHVITTRPMKGTVRRGRTTLEDEVQRTSLASSPKQRAENVMIVDMMRNDLGRIAQVGSVAVPRLFDVERYPNVWQMTSVVKARTSARLSDIFGALHPSASVTGAPKIRTMAILRDLEPHPRGVYTGAVGFVAPDGSARFNVAIRTALVDRAVGAVQFGIGSGLVWDSEAGEEYDECLLKGSILASPLPEFELLETLRWRPGEGFWLLDRHLTRLADSAAFFDRPMDAHRVRIALHADVAGASEPLRVRLLVGPRGDVRVEHQSLIVSDAPVRLRLSTAPVDRSNVFLFHKTTARQAYDHARLPDCDDTLLWNREGEVTEATTANVIVEVDGDIVTPPIECGLLAGTCRADLLAQGVVRERKVTIPELRRAGRMWVTNAVHGRRIASLIG